MNPKLLTGLIILVAVVVITESVVILNRLTPGQNITLLPAATPTTVPSVTADARFSLTAGSDTWTKGTSQTVTVALSANHSFSLDALDLYVKYDPSKVSVTKLNFPGTKPTLNKISPTQGLAIANYLITATEGLKLTPGQSLSLMTLSVTPKVTGPVQFQIATGQSTTGSTTMIIENETSKALSFDSPVLTVNVK